MMLHESPTLQDCEKEFTTKMVFSIARTVFGITPESIADDLDFRRAVFHAICERFIGVTMSDIQQAFLTHEPSEKVYVLSRKEFIEPIQQYWQKKMTVIRELSLIQKEEHEIIEKQKERYHFRKESEDIYRKSLEAKEWKGTMFHAEAIARDYSKSLGPETRKELWIKAQLDRRDAVYRQKLSIETNSDPFIANTPVPINEFFYSELIVKEAIKRGIGVIVE